MVKSQCNSQRKSQRDRKLRLKRTQWLGVGQALQSILAIVSIVDCTYLNIISLEGSLDRLANAAR